MKVKYVFLTLFLLLVTSGCYTTITGKVVDAETGKPIEGAVVNVEWTVTKGFGNTYKESYKVIEAVTDKDGKVTISGVFNPFVDPPSVTFYKKGYVAWNNKFIFPNFQKRKDFTWSEGMQIKMDIFKKEFSRVEHVEFLHTITHNGKLIYDAYRWEELELKSSGEVNEMDVGLAIESEKSVEHLISAVLDVNDALMACFKKREYGSDLIKISIGLILLEDSEHNRRFHPMRPFDYSRLERIKHPGTGHIIEIRNSAGWDVKTDFEKFRSMNLVQARGYLCEVLIDSTSVLEEHRSKFPNFDVARFRADFEACLRAHCSD